MYDNQVDIKTPEYVSLQFQPAGLGSRAAAFILDQLILMAVNLLIIIVLLIITYGQADFFFLQSMPSYVFGIGIVAIFAINWGYYFLLEFFWGGKTVGKRVLGIRVIQENGHSITLLSSFIRNLLRLIDSLPAFYFIGMTMLYLHSKHKRIGDLVAGTIVVHEEKVKKKKKMKAIEKEINRRGLRKEDLVIETWNLNQLGTKEWNLLKTYSNRFLQLPLGQRNHLTRKLAFILYPKLGLEVEEQTYEELEDTLLILYLVLKEEWDFER
ncbi:RDD family protein [Rossellomorea aquimaris]|uniref:RDD family protein n=1 Tax=Rossellomorea aquimaris TaxID=189382 RepID=UPI0007D08F0A|nr:RDD family protein [Rossellomorea aquimaris]